MLNTSQFLQNRSEIAPRHRPVSKSTWRKWHQSFRWKYTGFLIAAVFGTVALFLSVAFYKMNQNYSIFKQLAFDTNPTLVEHLDREVSEFGLFVFATLAAVFVFCLILGLRFTSNVLRPLVHLERHMKKVTKGDWSSPDFRFRANEDLSEFMDIYSYMYRSLRANTENEIKLLEKINIDPNNRESISVWKSLIQQKMIQLDLTQNIAPIVSIVAEIVPPPAVDRAS